MPCHSKKPHTKEEVSAARKRKAKRQVKKLTKAAAEGAKKAGKALYKYLTEPDDQKKKKKKPPTRVSKWANRTMRMWGM